ncbi:MAG: hypothetical protein EPN93_18865 [Spirochaetes bacterium]|nr:MAG: hypothetical protein EPN93_18865 [Spirochaetota bacterium]
MRRFAHRMIIVLSAATLLFASCQPESSKGDDNVYWVFDTTMSYDTDPNAWYTITTEKYAETAHAIVLVDTNVTEEMIGVNGVSMSEAQALADEFENNIYDKVTTYFAEPMDVDHNGKMKLLIYNIRDENYYMLSSSYIGGYFFSIDEYSNKSVQQAYPAMHSNQGEIMYIDCDPQDIETEAKGTIAHEFQHMVNFANAYANKTDLMDTWIDEGLAEAANHLCYGPLTDRIGEYNAYDTVAHPINRHPLFYWDYDNSLPNYDKSYLFFQFLNAQSAGGDDIYKAIYNNQYVDYRAIETAMGQDATLGGSSWGTTNQERFNRLVLRWYATNSGVAGTLYSYNGRLSGINQSLPSGASGLLSGAGAIKQNAGVFSSGSAVAGFIYLGVGAAGTGEDFNVSDNIPASYRFVAAYRNYYPETATSGTSSMPIVFSEDSLIESAQAIEFAGDRLFTISAQPRKIDLLPPHSRRPALFFAPLADEDSSPEEEPEK